MAGLKYKIGDVVIDNNLNNLLVMEITDIYMKDVSMVYQIKVLYHKDPNIMNHTVNKSPAKYTQFNWQVLEGATHLADKGSTFKVLYGTK